MNNLAGSPFDDPSGWNNSMNRQNQGGKNSGKNAASALTALGTVNPSRSTSTNLSANRVFKRTEVIILLASP